MIKLVIALVAGLGIGYTYGYLHADAGEDNLVSSAMTKVGIHHAVDEAQGSEMRMKREDLQRQARIDSLKQARIDSIASLIHH